MCIRDSSVHSVFEGLALGTCSQTGNFRSVFIAIASHGPIGAFALAVSLVKSSASRTKFWVLALIFCSMCPIGVCVGMVVPSDDVVQGVFQAIAAGTFVYVSVEEILPKELSHASPNKLGKILAYVAGVGFMAGVKVLDT
eukprot:TRINITY_DN4669_c0_g1_i3.p2 TRINITY_DN4669_c0_g1~~TRINITY_DN4669_c0_g1_i3.p2  ORF type:complete len:140 (+),score=26.14 TRINITY_DN4669_c0_g1_i3:161-580(+)